MGQALRILVAEDEAEMRQTIARALQGGDEAVEVEEVCTGPAAQVKLLQEHYDCAFLGHGLSGRNGMVVLREVRGAGIRTPIVLLTVWGDEELAVAAMKAGATDYLSKARFSPEGLRQSLRYAVRVHRAEQLAAEATERLRRSEEHLKRVVETNLDGIAILNTAGRVMFINPAAERIIGMSQQEVVSGQFSYGSAPWRRMHLDGTEMREEDRPINRVLRTGQPVYGAELLIHHTDGRQAIISLNAAALREPDGSICGVVASIRDITERRRNEQRLRDAEERYRSLFEQSAYGITIVDPETGRLLEFNTAAHEQLGYSREEFARLSVNDVDALETPEATRARIARILKSGADDFETQHRTKSGQIRDGLVSARRLQIAGKTLVCAIHQDITERNRLKEQLLQSQKMEAIGRLAGGVAHDFNNLLAVISGYSEAMLRRLKEGEPLYVHAAEIQKAAARGGSLTRQLLAFSRRQIISLQSLDLNQIIQNLHEMLGRVISRSIDLVFIPAPRLCRIKADPGQMEQVVINLALNARDAMPEGGTLTLATRPRRLDEPDAVQAGLKPGTYVELAVSDTGTGMDPAILSRIFEPFFTTKEGNGTGLGLSIVYSIVQQCGGNILVHSHPGQGSRFEVLLPCTGDEVAS